MSISQYNNKGISISKNFVRQNLLCLIIAQWLAVSSTTNKVTGSKREDFCYILDYDLLEWRNCPLQHQTDKRVLTVRYEI